MAEAGPAAGVRNFDTLVAFRRFDPAPAIPVPAIPSAMSPNPSNARLAGSGMSRGDPKRTGLLV